MISTPNLGLRVWNLTTDPYDSGQLADNWYKVDQHNHSSGMGTQVPTDGIQDGAVTSAKLAPGAAAAPAANSVTISTLGSDVTTDYGYAYSTYKVLGSRSATVTSGTAAGTYVFRAGDDVAVVAAGSTATAATAMYLDPADFAAGSRTTDYRIRVSCFTNSVAPAMNLVIGLYPVATWGGGSNVEPFVNTLSAVVAGSTTSFNTPGASSQTSSNSGDFTAPAAGWYVLGVNTSGLSATNSIVVMRVNLQVRQQ